MTITDADNQVVTRRSAVHNSASFGGEVQRRRILSRGVTGNISTRPRAPGGNWRRWTRNSPLPAATGFNCAAAWDVTWDDMWGRIVLINFIRRNNFDSSINKERKKCKKERHTQSTYRNTHASNTSYSMVNVQQ